MNCKKDDLAVVVDGIHKDKFVRCVSFVGDPGPLYHSSSGKRDFWEIDRKLSPSHSGLISDSRLRPIRDQPGNEQWFTAAPRSKPATTKQDTINERGELA